MDAVSGEEIQRVTLTEKFRARFGNPYAVIHRGDLHGVILKACREHPLIELRTASEVTAMSRTAPRSPPCSPTARASKARR